MSKNKEKIEKFKKILELTNNSLTKEEFDNNFKQIIDHVIEIKAKNREELEIMSRGLKEASKNAQNTTLSDFNALKGEYNELLEKNLTGLNKTFSDKVLELDDKLSTIRNGKDADEKKIIAEVVELIKIPTIEELKNDLPIMSEEVRNALELLQGKERLDITAIKGLEKRLKNIQGSITYYGSGNSGGRIVKALDLSSSLDGSTRTFNIQNVWRVISVHLTSSPTVMRETIDYTWTPTSITFTSEVPDISLSAGQTLIIQIAE